MLCTDSDALFSRRDNVDIGREGAAAALAPLISTNHCAIPGEAGTTGPLDLVVRLLVEYRASSTRSWLVSVSSPRRTPSGEPVLDLASAVDVYRSTSTDCIVARL
jgi:hypothetical protein